MKRLVLTSFQSPGDVVLLTAAVRDLHVAHPGRFATDVRSSAPELWENNPPVAPLDERTRDVETIDMHYPLIHESNQRPFHFIRGYSQYLESRLGLRIPVTRIHSDTRLRVRTGGLVPPTWLREAPVARRSVSTNPPVEVMSSCTCWRAPSMGNARWGKPWRIWPAARCAVISKQICQSTTTNRFHERPLHDKGVRSCPRSTAVRSVS